MGQLATVILKRTIALKTVHIDGIDVQLEVDGLIVRRQMIEEGFLRLGRRRL